MFGFPRQVIDFGAHTEHGAGCTNIQNYSVTAELRKEDNYE